MSPPISTLPAIDRRLMPNGDVRLVLAVAIAGSSAAVLADPILWLTTAAMVALLIRASRKAQMAPIANSEDLQHFPAQLRHVIHATRAALPEGDAKALLQDLVAHSANVFAPHESTFDAEWDRKTRRNVAELVDAACGVALDVGRLDLAFARTRDVNGPASHGLVATRQLFIGRLRDAASAVASLYAAGVEGGTPASDRVGDLVSELRADAALTSHARKELDTLLRTRA